LSTRRRPRLPSPTVAPQPAVRARKPAAIETDRADLLTQIAALGESGSQAATTARALLTRWWSRANWKTREELLQAARWTIRLEGRRVISP
jgi:hypothetical protein